MSKSNPFQLWKQNLPINNNFNSKNDEHQQQPVVVTVAENNSQNSSSSIITSQFSSSDLYSMQLDKLTSVYKLNSGINVKQNELDTMGNDIMTDDEHNRKMQQFVEAAIG